MSEKILLIDGHSILNRAFYGLPDLTNSEGKHTGAVYGFLNILFRTIEEEKPQYLTVAFDLKAPTFRHKMFEAYKGTRKPMPEELREQVPLIKEMLTAMGVNVVTKEGYEADDILGTLARKSEAAGMDATILSGDRDLLQLATDKVMIRLPKTVRGKTTIEDYHAQQVIEKYQVTPPQIIELKALMGDSADNIPGIPGVGEKTATKIIVEYGSIENAHEHLEELKPNRARESMREHYDMAQMSKALATICTDSPIEFSYEKAKLGNLYTKEAFLLCRQLEFKNLLNRFDSAAVQEDTLEQEFFTCADLAGCEALFAKAEAGKTAGVSLVTENGRVFGAGLALNEEEIYYIPVEGMITEGYLCGKLEGLMQEIQSGTQTTREPVYSMRANAHGIDDLGDTYIEVDLTEQYMWYYQNGNIIFQSEIVSGLPGDPDRKTPPGIFTLDSKSSPSVLRGEMTANGTYSYEQPVTYWMPFNGGIGFHDADWQPYFGGDRYLTGGSHGCINLPPENAGQLYSLIQYDVPIICFY